MGIVPYFGFIYTLLVLVIRYCIRENNIFSFDVYTSKTFFYLHVHEIQ